MVNGACALRQYVMRDVVDIPSTLNATIVKCEAFIESRPEDHVTPLVNA